MQVEWLLFLLFEEKNPNDNGRMTKVKLGPAPLEEEPESQSFGRGAS